ncbi:MAG: aldo/keto reductase [Candidatus Dormibacteraeota bacterium]|nr:aldo/keto reductase [Candidatus Dormibacteraeota bacterium]MBO0745562.1 aldo/keto reductase [Candidatus Dormibacteraeota bacterium]
MRVTGRGVWGPPPDEEQARAVLRRVVEAGVNFIDTADSYGPEVSERLIGEALRPYPKDLVIGTKGGQVRPGPNRWVPDGRPQHLREALEGSLRRLGVETIDLYQFHRVDPKVPFEESVGELVRLRDEGKIRLIGLSNVSVEQLEAAQKLTPVASVQNRFNLDDRSSDAVLEATERQGIAFLPWAPLGGTAGSTGAAIEEVAKAHGATVNQTALAWLLALSPVMLPIPGTGSLEHLEENLRAASLRLNQDDLTRLNRTR